LSGTNARADAAKRSQLPLLRTFESSRFRLTVASFLVLLGIAVSAARLALFDPADPSVALDFTAYYQAAERVLAGSSPYLYGQMEGSLPAFCGDCYLYPPFFAQLLVPVTLMPLAAAKTTWFVTSYAAAFVSTWLATGIGGAPRTVERAMWCLAAVLLFDVVASATWVGNVGTLIGLSVTMVAMGGAVAGVGATLGTFLKVVPVVLVPAVVASGRRSWMALLATLAIVGGCLVLLAPQSWLDYASVLPNVFAEPADSAQNLAPSRVVSALGEDAIRATRVAMLAAGAICIAVSVVIARRPGGMPVAALLGTVAMLVIPGTLWFHYLAVLLPFGAMAWPRARPVVRVLLLAAAVLVGLGPYSSEFVAVYVGATSMLVLAGWVLWPRTVEAHRTQRTVRLAG
jgi:hypothetical protein